MYIMKYVLMFPNFQVDYIHCLVPDLRSITGCSFYWGKMDRYEAERLLDGKPEGIYQKILYILHI